MKFNVIAYFADGSAEVTDTADTMESAKMHLAARERQTKCNNEFILKYNIDKTILVESCSIKEVQA